MTAFARSPDPPPAVPDQAWREFAAAGPESPLFQAFLKQQGVVRWSEVPVERVREMSKDPPDAAALLLAQKLAPGSQVLDYGCGTGRHLRFLRDCGFRPTGVEPFDTGIAVARAAFPEVPVYKLQLNAPLPFPDDSFDAVLSTYAIYHGLSATVHASIAECIRVLRPGGPLHMTLLSTRDFKFGCGPRFEPHTFGEVRPGETGEVHHFFDLAEILDVFAPLRKCSMMHVERPLDPPARLNDPSEWRQTCAHWLIQGEK